MCFSEIYVFAGEECDVVPEVFIEMALYSVPYGLGLADINGVLTYFWINTSKEVDA